MLLIYGLKMKNFFGDECLKYHSGEDTNKDIMLLDEIRCKLHCLSHLSANFNVIERSFIAGLKQ